MIVPEKRNKTASIKQHDKFAAFKSVVIPINSLNVK